jgi:hypothetical protein
MGKRYYTLSGLPQGKCLWVLWSGKPCRFLAEGTGMYCKKHKQAYHDMMIEAMKHPEKWVLRVEHIRGKEYRDYVYQE